MWWCLLSSALLSFVGFESRPEGMRRGHVRPWLQPRALFRAEVGAAWCVALGFCAFTPLCAALYLVWTVEVGVEAETPETIPLPKLPVQQALTRLPGFPVLGFVRI